LAGENAVAEDEIIPQPTLRVVAPKPRMTIYYALLIIALVAMVTACVFLYLVIRTFGGFGAVQGRVSSLDRPAGQWGRAMATVWVEAANAVHRN
jgi:hypothetical protein